jgi:RimJ/RimL family protein N-acetyltransferase
MGGNSTILSTSRLVLRDFTVDDGDEFHRINTHPAVLEFLGPAPTRAMTTDWIARLRLLAASDSPRLLAVVDRSTGHFIGYVGLAEPTFVAHFTPCVEIGWRLAPDSWGRGLASEAATVVLDWAFRHFALTEVLAFTAVGNLRSRRVMEKIGMNRDPRDDFDHPRLDPDNPLRAHVLYRIASPRAQHPAPPRTQPQSPR